MAGVRPILKWPGGKYRLLPSILPLLPPGRRLVEPFAGSGAVFMNAAYTSYLLCDTNRDLIDFYKILVERGGEFIEQCREHFTPETNEREAYYRRREAFNGSKEASERAALFLYLNRHGYNGLVRYNAGGGFNVPFGRHAKPYFPGEEMAAFLEKTRRAQVGFKVADFRETFDELKAGDVVYCDPPYIPLSVTANFTNYTGAGFDGRDQEELAIAAEKAARRGMPVVVSNHDTPAARGFYRNASRLIEVSVRRFISRDGGGRGMAKELLAIYCPLYSPCPYSGAAF